MPQINRCAVSGKNFAIRDEDLAFYEKISPVLNGKKYLIPVPRLCPRERERRRLAYRNERKLYKRKSSLSGAPMISFLPPDSPFAVYTKDEWWSDKWNSMNYGRPFDFNRSFFEQFYELQVVVPRPPLVNNKAENSDYCNFADANKNCYMLTSANRNQDSYYGFFMVENRDCVDCSYCSENELLHECIDCQNCYDLNFCQNCENCVESQYLFNCRGASKCLFCANLTNKEQYRILNKEVSKDQYAGALKAMKNPAFLAEMTDKFQKLKFGFPVKALNTAGCENTAGDYVFNSKNVFHGFMVYNSESCAYLHEGFNAENCFDVCFFDGVQWCYESTSLIGYGYRFTNFCRDSTDLFYCDNCLACANCFGCIGLRKKSYCVFNKQYAKEEYFSLIEQIIRHMAGRGEWGEFFPIRFSLFSYNETLAQDFSPLTKEEALKKGYRWRD